MSRLVVKGVPVAPELVRLVMELRGSMAPELYDRLTNMLRGTTIEMATDLIGAPPEMVATLQGRAQMTHALATIFTSPDVYMAQLQAAERRS